MADNLEETAGEDHSMDLLQGVSDEDRRKYEGKYVGYVLGIGEIIAFGDTCEEVAGKLRNMGKAGSDVAFIPPDNDYIYPVAA